MSTNLGLLTTHSKAFKDGFHVTVVKAATDRSLMTAGSSSVNHKNTTVVQRLDAVPTNCPAPVAASFSTLVSSSTQPPPVQNPSDDPCLSSSAVVSHTAVVSRGMKSGMKSTRTRPVRPSLSDQLAAIGAQAATLTQQIRTTHGLDTTATATATGRTTTPMASMASPLCTYPATSFAVGRLECRFPSPVQFFADRCEYTFHHPFESAEIRMVMYYRGGWMSRHTTSSHTIPRHITLHHITPHHTTPFHTYTMQLNNCA